ncbi:MAG: outer membrane beta-barrel protein [Variibacter sp.]|nr:outer membrane beta-barrel protein [Variibacter sp.]
MIRLGPLGLFGLIGASALVAAAADGFGQGLDGPAPYGLLRSGFDDLAPPDARRFERPQRLARAGRGARRPLYGVPPGFGAGKTGFVSTKARAQEAPPPGARPRDLAETLLPPEARAATGRPAGPRPGAAVEPARAEPLQPLRRERPIEEDSFAPTGFPVGGFVARPAVEIGGGYDSNPARTAGGRGSWFSTVAPELQMRSNWSRHELSANLRGSYVAYESAPAANRPTFDGRVNGRIDLTGRTRADLEARYLVATNNPGSPDLPAGLARLPLYTTVGATAGLSHGFNRLEVVVRGSVDRIGYEHAVLSDGSTVDNRDRDYDQYGALARASYELAPGVKPFAEASFDTRVHALRVDRFGQRRDSDGLTGRLGTTFEVSRKLTGEISVGYLTRTYKDPALPDLTGLIADGSLVWSATGLTTVKLTAASTADESTLAGVSGVLRRDGGVQVDHAFRRWLIGTARLGYGVDLYRGSPREDRRYLAALGLTYKMTRSVQVKGEVRREWLRSNVAGSDYEASIATLGVRLQR